MNALHAHIRILENTPRERITTHERKEVKDERTAAMRRKHSFKRVPLDPAMVRQYAKLKRAGERYVDIKRTLCVSVRTIVRLRDKAMQEGLL